MNTKDKILAAIEQDELDYHVLPHHGLVADWRARYVDLRDLILRYIDENNN